MFNANWKKWIDKFKERVTILQYASDKDINIYMQNSLASNFKVEFPLLLEILEKDPLTESTDSPLSLEVDDQTHICIKRKSFDAEPLANSPINELCATAQEETNRILKKLKDK